MIAIEAGGLVVVRIHCFISFPIFKFELFLGEDSRGLLTVWCPSISSRWNGGGSMPSS